MELVVVPENPLPEEMRVGIVQTSDGVGLRYAICAEGSSPRGTVCILQGRGDFIERYFETVRDLRRRGFAVALFDWRGQGGSDRPLRNRSKGHASSFRQYDRDLAAFMTGVALPDCPPPFFALAHSTGGNILLRTLSTRTWFTRAVITSPLLGLAPAPVPARMVGPLARAAVLLGLGRLSVPGRRRRPIAPEDFLGNDLTSDAARYLRDCATLAAAPHLSVGRPTFGWLRAALASIRQLQRKSAPSLRAPVLLVAPREDRVVSTEASRRYARRMAGVAAVIIDGSRHEVLMERDIVRQQFWAAFDAFLGLDPAMFPPPQTSRSRASASS